MIYLDHAATTPLPRAVAEAMYDVLVSDFANPSAQYPAGVAMKKKVEGWRAAIAAAIPCQPRQLHFTSCGTESDNWAIQAALWQNRRVGRHIITTAVEHSAILEPLKLLEQQGYEVTRIKPGRDGMVTARQVADALREDTALVTMMLVNNETGCMFPVAEVAALLRQRGSRALLHTDAVQAFLKVPCDPQALGVDMMSLSAHKIGGPKGIGALYVADTLRAIRPLLPGGGQEEGTRSGTEATAQIAGFAKAVEVRRGDESASPARLAALKDYCRRKLLAIPGLVEVARGDAPHIIMVSLPGYPSANVITDLGAQGICISAGSACHRGKLSHVVEALGLDKRTAAGVLRISFGPENTEADVDALAAALAAHQARRFPML